MKLLSKLFLPLFLFLLFVIPVSAKSFVYDSINVDIDIHENSDMVITEKYVYEFDGEFSGVTRGISIINSKLLEKCANDLSLQCGGFNSLELLEVYDNNGKILPKDAYTVEENYDSDTGKKYLDITWKFTETPRLFNKEKFNFGIKYIVKGGVGYFPDYELFYWNAIFEEHDVPVRNSTINVSLPSFKGKVTADDIKVLSTYGQDYTWNFLLSSNTLQIKTGELDSNEGLTVLWKIPKGILKEPGKIKVNRVGFWKDYPSDLTYYLNGSSIVDYDNLIENVPIGDVRFEVRRDGYKTQQFNFIIAEGETKTIDLQMQPEPLTLLLIGVTFIASICGCIFIPGSFFFAFWLWYTKGRDKKDKSTIVPEYFPPENALPYLIGSLRDEKVDIGDISSILIDVAYRGYIKIIQKDKHAKEFVFEKKNEFDDLSSVEKRFLNGIFENGKTSVSTTDLKEHFYTKLPGIQDEIYGEMVTKKYFDSKPSTTRAKYIGLGILLIILAAAILTPVSGFLISMTGFDFGIFSLQCAIGILGAIFLPLSLIMPAKTLIGSEMFRRFEGFKMYLEFAERYRLQNLTPETFEKFLSYAMVFGVEKQWAKNFESIYTGSPSWYEGQGNITPLYLANSLSSMNRVTTYAMASTPAPKGGSSGFSSGGGWSSGGGFSGGFSGGGGGGGRGGAF